MSEEPTNVSGDWRRRRRGGRSTRPPESDSPETTTAEQGEPEEIEVRSRTLFSFLEPSLNTIGTFGTPLVIAGIVAIVAGEPS